MEIVKPDGLISGFYAHLPDEDVPYLRFLGEQWAPTHYAISEHSHPVWEFYLQLDGWSVWGAEEKEFECPAGTIFVPLPNLVHSLKRASDHKHHFLFAAIDLERLVRERLPEVRSLLAQTKPIHFTSGGRCEASFKRLIRETTTQHPFRTRHLLNALEALVLDVARLFAEDAGEESRSLLARHPAVEAAKNAMLNHPGAPWTLRNLGQLAGVSPNHLAFLFRQEVGCGPHEFLTRHRIDLAKLALGQPEASVSVVALDLGFSSAQHFSRVFSQVTGVTPSAFRRQLAS
jgi:AraC-like DNA-binding protein